LHYDVRLKSRRIEIMGSTERPAAKRRTNHTALLKPKIIRSNICNSRESSARRVRGGTVMVWDIGTYEVLEGNYWKGLITIFLFGKKLKGEWTLQRTDSDGEKRNGSYAKLMGAPNRSRRSAMIFSALTGRTMERHRRRKIGNLEQQSKRRRCARAKQI